MFEVCFSEADIFKSDIRDDKSTFQLWRYLETELTDIFLSDDQRVCELAFDNNQSIHIWSKDMDHDNLFVVRRFQSDEWWTIG